MDCRHFHRGRERGDHRRQCSRKARGAADDTRKALRELIGKLPDDLRNDPSVSILCEAAKENTVTVVHLIYRSKNYESSSKDYDFSRIAMVEHWTAGERDVYLSMRHKEWLEQPQSGETLKTYDLAGEDSAAPATKRSE